MKTARAVLIVMGTVLFTSTSYAGPDPGYISPDFAIPVITPVDSQSEMIRKLEKIIAIAERTIQRFDRTATLMDNSLNGYTRMKGHCIAAESAQTDKALREYYRQICQQQLGSHERKLFRLTGLVDKAKQHLVVLKQRIASSRDLIEAANLSQNIGMTMGELEQNIRQDERDEREMVNQ
jgi:hypothetical protein